MGPEGAGERRGEVVDGGLSLDLMEQEVRPWGDAGRLNDWARNRVKRRPKTELDGNVGVRGAEQRTVL